MEYICFGFIALVIIAAIVLHHSEKNRKEAQQGLSRAFRSIEGVSLDKKHVAPDAKSGIAIDIGGENVLIASSRTAQTVQKFGARDIVSAEVRVDDVTVTKTSRGSQVGGVIVGGVLAGGAGAIIGGLSGKQTSAKDIRKVDLLVVVDDPSRPRHSILFHDHEVTKNMTIPADPKAAVELAEE